jgi:hypothetical protein
LTALRDGFDFVEPPPRHPHRKGDEEVVVEKITHE